MDAECRPGTATCPFRQTRDTTSCFCSRGQYASTGYAACALARKVVGLQRIQQPCQGMSQPGKGRTQLSALREDTSAGKLSESLSLQQTGGATRLRQPGPQISAVHTALGPVSRCVLGAGQVKHLAGRHFGSIRVAIRCGFQRCTRAVPVLCRPRPLSATLSSC